jgi:stage V sporulation protein R
MTAATMERLYEGADWDFPLLQRLHDACEEVASDLISIPTRSK